MGESVFPKVLCALLLRLSCHISVLTYFVRCIFASDSNQLCFLPWFIWWRGWESGEFSSRESTVLSILFMHQDNLLALLLPSPPVKMFVLSVLLVSSWFRGGINLILIHTKDSITLHIHTFKHVLLKSLNFILNWAITGRISDRIEWVEKQLWWTG